MALPTPKTPLPAAVTTPPATATTADDVRAAAEGERARIVAIQRAGTTLGRPSEEIAAAIETGTSADAFRAAAIDAHAAAATIRLAPRIEAGEDSRDKWQRGALHWLLIKSGKRELIERHAAKIGSPEVIDPGEFRGLTLLDLARQALDRSGSGALPRGASRDELFGRALTQRSGGMTSTGDFPVLLESVVNKVLLASFGLAPLTWNRFCATGSVSDFRPSTRYRKGSFGRLDPLIEGGEIKTKAIPDGKKESIRAGTFGNIVSITRQALINDDLGATVGLAADIGEGAAWSVEADVFDLLALNSGLGPTMTDGQTLFHATHANIGTGSALSVAGLDADRALLARQKGPNDNRFISLRPSVLLVPTELRGAALILNASQFDPDAVNKLQLPNKVAGLFREVIDTPLLTGTRRYTFSDQAPAIEVVFLDGNTLPYTETRDGWRVDGTDFKVVYDYGVGAIEHRGAVTNAGA